MTVTTVFDELHQIISERGFTEAAVGIDLGTTKSCIALADYDNGVLESVCQPIDEPGQPAGTIAVPSVVALQDGQPVFGHAARRLARRPGYDRRRQAFSETKNEMGLRFTYENAPEGFRNAADIAGHLIHHLIDSVGLDDCLSEVPVVITVPASFHGAQRHATLQAARSVLGEGGRVSILDEPYAAMLDLLHRRPDKACEHLRQGANWLVFDFGGGTCDVALFTLQTTHSSVLAPRLCATSRYHRIGGGDIDRAIVHGHLIPQLLMRYGLARTAVSWHDKRKYFEPVLIPVAEQLKRALCERIRSCSAADSRVQAEVVSAGDHCIEWQGRELFLSDARLDRQTFEQLLQPFINTSPGRQESDEFVERDSVFRPIVQVLARTGLKLTDVDVVLLAGSSSLIPQVQSALQRFFRGAALLELGDPVEIQGAIARGAALQALSLAATGQPLIAPVCSADLSLRTRQGPVLLVKAGTRLPVAATEPLWVLAPEVPATRSADLAIEVLADNQRIVGRSIWQLKAPVKTGEPLMVQWTLDENQRLTLRLERAQSGVESNSIFEHRFDAPLTHIDQEHRARCQLLEHEETMRRGDVPVDRLGETFEQMARHAGRIGHYEQALHYITCALQYSDATNYLINLQAMYLEELGDAAAAEAKYQQASNWSIAAFNLALFLNRKQRHQEALSWIDKAIEKDADPAYLVLKGDIVAALGNKASARLHYQDAVSRLVNPKGASNWTLGWAIRGARVLGQYQLVDSFSAARTESLKAEVQDTLHGAFLPERHDGETVIRTAV